MTIDKSHRDENLNLLVLEDSESDFELIKEQLIDAGYQLSIERVDTEDAFAASLREKTWDLLIADFRLPSFDAFDALRIRNEVCPNTPFICVSGIIGEETAIELLKSGAVDYVLKDRPDRLPSAVGRALEEAREKRISQHNVAELRKVTMAVEQAAEVIFITEINGTIRYANPALTDVTGYSREEVVGKNPRLFNSGTQDRKFYQTLWDTITAGRVWKGRMVNKRKDGTLYTEETTISPVKDDAGQICNFVAVKRDISESLLLEAKLRQAQRLESVGMLASGIGHDINNTLAPIMLYTEALLESEQLSEQAQRFLRTIRKATQDIVGTLQRLRMFYKNADSDNFEVCSFDASQLLNDVIDLTRPKWRDLAQKNGIKITLEIQIEDQNLIFSGVESDIRESLINLVFNAVDAMPNGGTITLRARGNQDQRILEVIDTGIGMSAEQREKCIEPFFTTKGDKGSGLGLPMVFGVLKRHQGEIQIESEPGNGTTVRLIFPVSKEGLPKSHVEDSSTLPPVLKILNIEDDSLVRKVLREILELDGHSVTSAENGNSGIISFKEALRSEKGFDLVITDLGMPEMDGWEVAELIKQLSPGTPVFMLSGWGDFLENEGDETKKVDIVLAKPPKIRDLRRAIRNTFNQRPTVEDANEK